MAETDDFEVWRQALMNTSPAKVKKLLKTGGDVHQTDEHGRTPLLWLANAAWMCPKKDKLAECAKLLLEAGANPNVVETASKPFENVLMYAVRDNNPAFVKAVLDAGADMTFLNPDGQTALDLATVRGAAQEIREMLSSHGAARKQDYTLTQAAYGGDLPQVEKFLAEGAKVDEPDERGRTPLYYAVVKGHAEVAFALIEAGANPKALGPSGENLLVAAGFSGSEVLVNEFLKLGLDVNGGEAVFHTPLMAAIHYDHLAAAKLLLAAGADPSRRNSMGQTAEKMARQCAKSVRAEMLALLAEQGAIRDPVLDAPKTFRRSAESDSFLSFSQRLSEILAQEPKSWTRNKAVLQYSISRFDKLAAAWANQIEELSDASPEDRYDLYFAYLQGQTLEAGFVLCLSEPDERSRRARLYLFPTSDQLAIVAAWKTDAPNYGLDTGDIITWLRALHQDAAFLITYCGKDFLGGRFLDAPGNPSDIAERIASFCPDAIDGDALEDQTALAESIRESRSFDLWWD